MSYEVNPYSVSAVDAPAEDRGAFLNRVYLHLLGAIVAFLALEYVLLQLPVTEQIVGSMLNGAGGYSWLIVLGLFMGVSFIANRWAQSDTSIGLQYAGLGLYVVGQAIVFVPLMYIAAHFGGANVIPTAGFTTAGVFLALTATVYVTRFNFSFLGPFLAVAGIGAMIYIVCSIVFGFSIGIAFTVIMIVFACGAILYDTSRILHDYRTDQHVAASLALFASVALLFWYILQLFMSADE